MKVLTDEEVIAIRRSTRAASLTPFADTLALSRAIEDAVIRKLAAGVSVEPVAERRRIRYSWGECWDYRDDEKVAYTAPGFDITLVTPAAPLYTAAAIAAARVQENERCLALMDAIGCDWRDAGDMAKFYATNYLCDAIRALLGKEAQL